MQSNTKSLNLDFFPKSLLLEVGEVLGEEFNQLPYKIQTGYTLVFWSHSGLIKSNTHRKDPNSFAMDTAEIERYFTDIRDFNAVSMNGYYLKPRTRRSPSGGQHILSRKDVDGSVKHKPTEWVTRTVDAYMSAPWHGVVGVKNGYQLAPSVHQLLDVWSLKSVEEIKDKGFINIKGETLRDIEEYLEGAIYRDKSSAPASVNVNLFVDIDIDTLMHHHAQLEAIKGYLTARSLEEITLNTREWFDMLSMVKEVEGEGSEQVEGSEQAIGRGTKESYLKSLLSKDITSEGINQRLSEIRTLLLTIREEGGHSVPVIYREVKTGRYTSNNAILQGYHKSVRYAALSGCWEYDLEAAHQNILLQLLERKGVDSPELDTIREYVKHKKEVREELAEEVSTSISIVKEIIQSLTYGAQLNRSSKNSLYDTCKGDKNLLDRVCSSKWLKDFQKAFKLAQKHLISAEEEVVNAVGIKCHETAKSKQLAHILQGYERLILDAVIKHSKRRDIALLVHDCVVFYNKQSVSKLSKIVKDETGFKLEFSEDQY